MEGEAGPGPHLVADHERGEEVGAVVEPFGLVEREEGGQQPTPGVPLRQAVAVVGIDGIDGHPAGERRPGR